MLKRIAFLPLFALVILTGCKKDEPTATVEPSGINVSVVGSIQNGDTIYEDSVYTLFVTVNCGVPFKVYPRLARYYSSGFWEPVAPLDSAQMEGAEYAPQTDYVYSTAGSISFTLHDLSAEAHLHGNDEYHYTFWVQDTLGRTASKNFIVYVRKPPKLLSVTANGRVSNFSTDSDQYTIAFQPTTPRTQSLYVFNDSAGMSVVWSGPEYTTGTFTQAFYFGGMLDYYSPEDGSYSSLVTRPCSVTVLSWDDSTGINATFEGWVYKNSRQDSLYLTGSFSRFFDNY